ncbi:MAG: autotransporter-associated beta strand repeat-containing protein [Akkermansia sp.]|nr:autotransporter-associated beta strand repeat-containing protein [Akkermansia sp.]
MQNISSATNNSLATNSSIKVMGGKPGGTQTSKLVMDNVDTTIQAQLSNFSTMTVTNGSDLTLTHGSNASLGGVDSVIVDGNSTLNLEHAAGQAWTEYAGRIDVEDGSKLHLSGPTNAKLNLASGSTLSVKEGDLFAAAPASGYNTLSGVTLEANEGNWTINKAIKVNGATITGSHAVAFGSEVDSGAVVTMSGEIGTTNTTNGHLILKNTAVAEGKTATLSGNITFEGAVNNANGTLAIADGSTINIDEQFLIRNATFIENGQTSKNGFLTDTAIGLTTGGNYAVNKDKVTLTLDGTGNDKLVMTTDPDALKIKGYDQIMKGTYFVNEGNVDYSDIKNVEEIQTQGLTAITIGNNGTGNTHQLTLDEALANGVTVVSASDHAQVSVSEGVELKASQTAIKGEANEIHVTGAGTVLLDRADKLSQLAGNATMKVDTAKVTSFDTEAKMTGALEVVGGSTLTVTGKGTTASFTSVDLAANTTLKSEVAHDDTIQALSGSGSLSKTGTGKLTISGDSSAFNGNVNVEAGTLEVQNAMTANTLSGSGKLAKTGTGDMTVKDASGFKGDIEATSGTLQLEQVALETPATGRKVSVSNGATVNLVGMENGADGAMTELHIDGGTFGVYINGKAVTGDQDTNVGNLTLATGNKIVIGQSESANKLVANLTTESGSILDFSSGGQLTMGCTLDVGKGTIIVLSDEKFATASEGEAVTLFDSVEDFAMENYVRVTLKSASGEQMLGEVSFQGDKATLTVKGIPEPTTGTLSLLALAGLCARRRRKH